MNAIFLVFWLQMHVLIVLNLWSDIVVHMILWFFCKGNHQRTPKVVPVSNLRLLKYVFSVVNL